MPRQPRIDIPGLLHHVIFRGIDGCKIVKDDIDRLGFVTRLGALSEECQTPIYAWTLLNNHAHLLVRSSEYGLPRFMRRLLTGHAITFNLRHKRHGHLFQNRYKSIICEEESYFLELVRYIHLNPLRAGQVKDIDELKSHPWCGHATLIGQQNLPWQCHDEVLSHFGRKEKPSIAKYEQFILDGFAQGKRPELVGGGLRRSQANRDEIEIQPEAYDDRILGGGDFVEQILNQTEENTLPASLRDKQRMGEECLKRISKKFAITPQELHSGSRRHPVSAARALIAWELVSGCGWSITATGRSLGVSTSAISKILLRDKRV